MSVGVGGGQASKQVQCACAAAGDIDIKACGPQGTVPEDDLESTVSLSGPAESLPCLLDRVV